MPSCHDECWRTLYASIYRRRARANLFRGARPLGRTSRIYSAHCSAPPRGSYDRLRSPFHTSCVSSSAPGPTAPSPPTDGYDWFCHVCVETLELVGSLFRSLVPVARTDDAGLDGIVPSTFNTLATTEELAHPTETDTVPPIPDPPLGGNPARYSAEDATADAVPIYLAMKHAAYAPAKWILFYLYMRRHYADECLARTPTTLAGAVQHHTAVSRHVLFHPLPSTGCAHSRCASWGAQHARRCGTTRRRHR